MAETKQEKTAAANKHSTNVLDVLDTGGGKDDEEEVEGIDVLEEVEEEVGVEDEDGIEDDEIIGLLELIGADECGVEDDGITLIGGCEELITGGEEEGEPGVIVVYEVDVVV